jgi:hypothetical protein
MAKRGKAQARKRGAKDLSRRSAKGKSVKGGSPA